MSRDALLHNPGLHLMGGGERYTFALAEVLMDAGFDVTVTGPKLPSAVDLAARGFSPAVRLRELAWSDLSSATDGVDLFVQSTAFAPVRSLARRSFAVVQFPIGSLRKPLRDAFAQPASLPWYREHSRAWYRDQREYARAYRYIVYSDYVRRWLRLRWHQRAAVLAPSVELGSYEPTEKESLIVAVGRFFPEIHHKRHDVLIEAFRSLTRSEGFDRWSLVLVGGVDWSAPGAHEHMANLHALADGLNVVLRVNAAEAEVRDLYRRASLFWHAAGFGRSRRQPEQAEHFGMSVVEAMSNGAVPVVFDDGGPRQIVQPGWGERWRLVDDLIAKTAQLVKAPLTMREKAAAAEVASRRFSRESFAKTARLLLLEA